MGIMAEKSRTLDLAPEQLKQVRELLTRYLPNTEVWAYGSRVKGTAKPWSDLDLAAIAGPQQKAAIADLREAFDESDLPFRVDLFVWEEIPETFRDNIRKEHIVLTSVEQP